MQCKTEVWKSEDAFQCDSCNKTLRYACTNMDKKQIEKLLNENSLEDKCQFCLLVGNESVSNDIAEIKTKRNQLDDIR